jgi:hypothetical protein
LLDCETENVRIEIDYTSEFFMMPLRSEKFYELNLEAR